MGTATPDTEQIMDADQSRFDETPKARILIVDDDRVTALALRVYSFGKGAAVSPEAAFDSSNI